MNGFIDELIEMGMGRFMDKSRDELAERDELYQSDTREEARAEQRYERLDLSEEKRLVINEYVESALTVNHRYADISYIAGIKDTVRMLVSLGVIKGMEPEE